MMNALEAAGQDRPIRKSAQRFRWFFRSFEEKAALITEEAGVGFSVDQAVLAQVFADWLKSFNAQKPEASEDNPAYVGFAAGLMLRTLIVKKPITSISKPEDADDTLPVYFWPEGYLYVTYCLHVRGMVIEMDFDGLQKTDALLGNKRTWWSFKENVARDPSMAIAFLDLFASEPPDWTMPGLFRVSRGVPRLGHRPRTGLIRPLPDDLSTYRSTT